MHPFIHLMVDLQHIMTWLCEIIDECEDVVKLQSPDARQYITHVFLL